MLGINHVVMNVLIALIVAVIGAITKNLLPYLKAKKEEAMGKLRQSKWCWAVEIIDAVVRAVEQTVTEDIHGLDKKKLALEYIKPFLEKNGIHLSDEEIDSLIEAAVQAMNEGIIKVEADE